MHARLLQSCLFETLLTVPTRLRYPWDPPGKNTEMGCHALLQGIFPTQGSNLHNCCTKPHTQNVPILKFLIILSLNLTNEGFWNNIYQLTLPPCLNRTNYQVQPPYPRPRNCCCPLASTGPKHWFREGWSWAHKHQIAGWSAKWLGLHSPCKYSCAQRSTLNSKFLKSTKTKNAKERGNLFSCCLKRCPHFYIVPDPTNDVASSVYYTYSSSYHSHAHTQSTSWPNFI